MKNLILIGINFFPAASLAPDKGTGYKFDKSRHLQEATGTFLPRLLGYFFFFFLPECLCVQIAMLDRQAFFFSPSILSPFFSFPIFTSDLLTSGDTALRCPPPAPGYVWKETPAPETAAPRPASSLGQGKANSISLAEKRPTSRFTFVVTCLFRQAAAGEGSFWHCLASI